MTQEEEGGKGGWWKEEAEEPPAISFGDKSQAQPVTGPEVEADLFQSLVSVQSF